MATADHARLLALTIKPTRQRYHAREHRIYALGVGCGGDPANLQSLAWLQEDPPFALPTMATILGYDGFWLEREATGIDATQALHVEQGLLVHRPLPSSGEITRCTEVTGLVDRGIDKGLFVHTRDLVYDAADGTHMATLTSVICCRDAGGEADAITNVGTLAPPPDRAADLSQHLVTSPQQGWIYSLSGDNNPLHLDPDAATRAGFDKPVLQGLCTYGIACVALLALLCDNRAEALRSYAARFTAPVFPGDALQLWVWRNGAGQAQFRVDNLATGRTALDRGHMAWEAHS